MTIKPGYDTAQAQYSNYAHIFVLVRRYAIHAMGESCIVNQIQITVYIYMYIYYVHVTVFARSEYGQAVRTLRAALNIESKKKNDPKFRRKDYNFSCYFALTKVSLELFLITFYIRILHGGIFEQYMHG